MTWWEFAIIIALLFIDQQIDHYKRIKDGVQIHNYNLANDPEFIDDVSEAIKRSVRRDMQRYIQDKSDIV